MASFHCWPWIVFPFLIIIRLLTQTPESIFLKSKTNSIRPLYSRRCRHTYRCLTPVCSLLPTTLKSVREPGPESLYPPAHWNRQGGAGFAAHYRFIELITIRIITLNAGWGAGRFSARIARSNFSPERRWRGYWICQAWTLWHRNELHKVSRGWAQFAALIPIRLQHGEICTTYWTNNKRREGERMRREATSEALFSWRLSPKAWRVTQGFPEVSHHIQFQ